MGSYTTFSKFKQSIASPQQIIYCGQSATSNSGTVSIDSWASSQPSAGAAPSTAVVPTSATTGAVQFKNGGSGRLTIAGGNFGFENQGTVILCDRLSHQGGLSGIVTTAQTTNLPTAALTRYTDGVGVMIGITIYTAVGGTTASITASYTNQAGTSGQTTLSTQFGGSGAQLVPRFIILPLQAGDSGVRSVESITLSGTTGTAGNFGVTLFKPLWSIAVTSVGMSEQVDLMSGNTAGGFPEILDDACLFWMVWPRTSPCSNYGTLSVNEI